MSLPPQPAILSRPFFEDKNRAFWTLQAAGWTGYLILRSVSSISNASDMTSMVPVVIESIVGYSITLLLSTLYHYYRRQPRFAMAILTVLTLAAATLVYAVLDAFSFSFINARNPGLNIGLVLGTIFLNFTVLAGWTALYFGINFYLIVEDQIDQLAALENTASSAQLAMLRYQLNPHFLFNTLNSISTLVLLKQTEPANAMLSRLSSFLRYTLVNEPTGRVTVAQEAETLKLYLDIERMRFEERLRTEFRIEDEARNALLPSLLLQPLVENAIKYAVSPLEEGAQITIAAQLVGPTLRVTVSDTGPGLQPGTDPTKLFGVTSDSGDTTSVWNGGHVSTGVGLANIRDRLAQAYGENQRFDIANGPEGGLTVVIELPYEAKETPARPARPIAGSGTGLAASLASAG